MMRVIGPSRGFNAVISLLAARERLARLRLLDAPNVIITNEEALIEKRLDLIVSSAMTVEEIVAAIRQYDQRQAELRAQDQSENN